jgi:hypothetical protein
MVIMVKFESWPPSCICRVIEPSPLWVFFASYFKISFFLYITALSYFPLQQSVLVNFFDKFLAVRLLANSILLSVYLSINLSSLCAILGTYLSENRSISTIQPISPFLSQNKERFSDLPGLAAVNCWRVLWFNRLQSLTDGFISSENTQVSPALPPLVMVAVTECNTVTTLRQVH